MSFETVVHMVLEHEGGYVNHPSDPGGETKYGISKRAYPDVDIAELTKDDAADLYKRDYWDRIKGDDLPAGVACAVHGLCCQFRNLTCIKSSPIRLWNHKR